MTLNGAPGAGDGGSEPRPYRIIVVDPQRLFRQALRALLDAQAGFTVVGETGSAAEARGAAGGYQATAPALIPSPASSPTANALNNITITRRVRSTCVTTIAD